ncbi:MAG: hypothetical protein AABY27_05740 [Pseudomonadota bacterium]
MGKQKFALDFTDILSMSEDQLASLDDVQKSFIAERYNPIIAELEELYKENPNLDQNDDRVKALIPKLEKFTRIFDNSVEKNLLAKTNNLNDALGGSSSSTPTHMAFILQGLKNNKNLGDIVLGYEHNGEHREGLNERFKGQFYADFNRSHPKVKDQNGAILDDDLFVHIHQYTKLTKALSELREMSKERPRVSTKDPRVLKIRKEIIELRESIQNNNDSSIVPEVNKSSLTQKLDFVLEDMNKQNDVTGLYNNLQTRFDKWTGAFTKTSYEKELKTRLNLSDEQLKLLVSRYSQRSLIGSDASLYAVMANTNTRKETFHVRANHQGVSGLNRLEYNCTTKQAVTDKNGFPVIDDETDSPLYNDLHSISHITDVSKLTKNDIPGEVFVALPTQKAPEIITYNAVSEEGRNYELSEALETKCTTSVSSIEHYNNLLEKDSCSKEDILEIANTPNIEKDLTSKNLKKLIGFIGHFQIDNQVEPNRLKDIVTKACAQENLKENINSSIIEAVIKNEIENSDDQSIKQIQENLAKIFSDTNIVNDASIEKNIQEYRKHKNPDVITKLSQYIHATFIHGISVDEYRKYKTDKIASKLMNKFKDEVSDTYQPHHSNFISRVFSRGNSGRGV